VFVKSFTRRGGFGLGGTFCEKPLKTTPINNIVNKKRFMFIKKIPP
jgi:hypothetical protein